MLNVGRMDRRILIEREAETAKPSGSVMKTWSPIATAWAELMQNSAAEQSAGFGELEAGTVVFRIRHLPGITTADRLVYDGRAYGLKEVIELGRKAGLELRAVATR